jgi:hypothetical protein
MKSRRQSKTSNVIFFKI